MRIKRRNAERTRRQRPARALAALAGLAALGLAALAAPAPAAAQHSSAHDPRALAADPRTAGGPIAPLLEGLGDLHFEVTTSSERAQLFFDQGLKLTYGFNHQEALRAFKEAARLDPDCAMAYWGWALVLGPNLNLPMQAEVVEQAWEAIQLAAARRDKVSEKERAFIDALATRYSTGGSDRLQLDVDYADAMGELYDRFPEDDEAAALYAAALMNLTPWNYWTRDRRPTAASVDTALVVLETVIERSPRHIGALHYYIHLVEPVDPERGERAADLLRGLAPGAGHLVHMPSHIYIPLGRFAEAYEANARAAEADEDYITQCRAQGLYPLTYYPHNVHFLTWAATNQGRSSEALAAARKVASRVPLHELGGHSLYESFFALPIDVMVRFAMWERILAEPEPPESARFWTGMWRFARGLAFAKTGSPRLAAKELAILERLLDDPATAEALVGFSTAETLLTIAREILGGELLLSGGDVERALARFERAVRLEDSLAYNEPPSWFTPTRLYLGDALLRAGRPLEAEVVYWKDLTENRENGFALAGLARALAAQGREAEAESARRRFRVAWADADVELAPGFGPPSERVAAAAR